MVDKLNFIEVFLFDFIKLRYVKIDEKNILFLNESKLVLDC